MIVSTSRLAAVRALPPQPSSTATSLSALAAVRRRLASQPLVRPASSSNAASSFSTSTAAYRSSPFARSPLTSLSPSALLSVPAPWQQPPRIASTAFLASARHLSLFSASSKATTADAKDAVSRHATEAKETVVEKADQPIDHVKESASHAAEQVQHASSDAADSFVSAAHDTTAEPVVSSVSNGLFSDAVNSIDATAASTLSETLASAGFAGVQAGQLSSLGLAHWTSPVGWVTQLLDFVGTNTGLPWWGTIVVTTVALRIALAPINIAGQKNAIRLGNISPRMKVLMDDVKHHKAVGDQRAMQEAVSEVQRLMRDNNANPFKSFTPIFFQFPLMFSFFLALERIVKSGATGFDIGGPFWTTDLSSPDPTYLLPLVSTAATLAVAELGFKLGTTGGAAQDQTQSKIVKYVFRGAMPIIGYFATTFPSGVLVYWATTNLWSLGQMLVLQIPFVRRAVKFPVRIQPAPSPYAQKEPGIMERLKQQMSESTPPTAKRVSPPTASRLDAFKEILDQDAKAKIDYDATSTVAAAAAAAANPTVAAHEAKRKRIAKARARRQH